MEARWPLSNPYAVRRHTPAELVTAIRLKPISTDLSAGSAPCLFPACVFHKGWSSMMMDVVVLAMAIGFFALTLGYVGLCDTL